MKIVFVASKARSLRNFRGKLLLSLVENGHEVTVISTTVDEKTAIWLETHNIGYVVYDLKRNGTNVFSEMRMFFGFIYKFQSIKSDIVLAYTIKPVIWTGLYKLLYRKKFNYTALITGLGYAFSGTSRRKNILKNIASWLYKISLISADKVVFQNIDNLNYFVSSGIVKTDKCHTVDGSGVDLDFYKYVPVKIAEGRIIFLMVARLLGDKGVREYVSAAIKVRSKHDNVEFRLLGGLDDSKDSLSQLELQQIVKEPAVEYLGETEDVRPYLESSSVFVLPSYHEGLPRSALEAMSIGRMIVTTDVPGCREVVEEGVNGLLVAPSEVAPLVAAFEKIIENPSSIKTSGENSRAIALERFCVNKINRIMKAYLFQ